MIKALLLIFKPIETWDEVVRAQRSIVYILTAFLLPLLVLTSVAEGCGLVYWGKRQGDVVKHVKQFSVKEVVVYEAVQLVLSFGLVIIGAKIIKSLGETFHGRHTYKQAFTAVAYGLSSLFTLRLVDAFPITPWAAWIAGALLSAMVLYNGVPHSLEPDPAHAFGLYLMSALLLVIASALVRFLTAWYLEGKFKMFGSAVWDSTSQILFS